MQITARAWNPALVPLKTTKTNNSEIKLKTPSTNSVLLGVIVVSISVSSECRATRDFMRHIVNRVISDNINRIPSTIVDDIKKYFGRAEDKYKFTIYGGNPSRLLDYFESEDWKDTLKFLLGYNLEWLIKLILEALARDYAESCEPVAQRAKSLLGEIERLKRESERSSQLTPEYIYRKLSNAGYKVRLDGNVVEFEEGLISVRIEVSEDTLNYRLCKTGSAKSLDGVMVKLEKMREI